EESQGDDARCDDGLTLQADEPTAKNDERQGGDGQGFAAKDYGRCSGNGGHQWITSYSFTSPHSPTRRSHGTSDSRCHGLRSGAPYGHIFSSGMYQGGGSGHFSSTSTCVTPSAGPQPSTQPKVQRAARLSSS